MLDERATTASEEIVRKKVSRFVLVSIGDRLHVGTPKADSDFWRVPVFVRLSNGEDPWVGEIVVEKSTGDLQLADDTIEKIVNRAREVNPSVRIAEHNAS